MAVKRAKAYYFGINSKQKDSHGSCNKRWLRELRLRHVPDSKAKTIRGFVSAHISEDAENVYTDEIRRRHILTRWPLSS